MEVSPAKIEVPVDLILFFSGYLDASEEVAAAAVILVPQLVLDPTTRVMVLTLASVSVLSSPSAPAVQPSLAIAHII